MYPLKDLPIDPAANIEIATKFFLGNPAMGWKVAWSDRMVAMYSTPLLVAIAYSFFRHRITRPIPWGLFFLLLLPMALDGGTHMISDFSSGIGQGFRDSNLWLAQLTGYRFPTSFYAGDGLGSFNSLMRLSSGLSFGIGVGGLLYPALQLSFTQPRTLVPHSDALAIANPNSAQVDVQESNLHTKTHSETDQPADYDSKVFSP